MGVLARLSRRISKQRDEQPRVRHKWLSAR